MCAEASFNNYLSPGGLVRIERDDNDREAVTQHRSKRSGAAVKNAELAAGQDRFMIYFENLKKIMLIVMLQDFVVKIFNILKG